MFEPEAAEWLERGTYVDYCAGRPIKVNFNGDSINEAMYDRDAGQGMAAKVIAALRASTPAAIAA